MAVDPQLANDRARLILTIQRQTETLDKLHSALRDNKERLTAAETSNKHLENENRGLLELRLENADFRRELGMLQSMVEDFQRRQEELKTREQLSLDQQAEIHVTESKIKDSQLFKLSEEVTLLRRSVSEKDNRISLLVEKMTMVNPPDVEIKLEIEDMHQKMIELQQELKMRAEQVRAVTAQSDHLKSSLVNANEELQLKTETIQALERENKALQKNVSQLIRQVHVNKSTGGGGGGGGASHLTPILNEATAVLSTPLPQPPLSPSRITNGNLYSTMSRIENYRNQRRN